MRDLFPNIEQAANSGAYGCNPKPLPSDASKKAGNYSKGKVAWRGMTFSIEQPRNSIRSGIGENGKRWQSMMRAHYGGIVGVRGADNDLMDVFVGAWPESETVWVINQKSKDGGFDEHKCLLCFESEEAARNAYMHSYERGWRGLGSMIKCTLDQFKWWIKNGNHKRPLAAKDLPFDGTDDMEQTVWDSAAEPVGTDLAGLIYALRKDDAEGLMLDSITVADILEAADGEMALDALVVPMAKLERKMQQLQNIMSAAGESVSITAMQITPPFKQRGTTNVAVVFELSDGQTVTIYLHNPDTTPNKLAPTDEMISWKWLLNKKDVTILVAPEKGEDLNPREVGRRIMKLAERNSARFAQANKNRSERLASIESLKTGVQAKEAELESLTKEIEVLTVQVEEKKAKTTDEYINIGGARVRNTPEDILAHTQKTFPNVKQVDEEGSPVFQPAAGPSSKVVSVYSTQSGKEAMRIKQDISANGRVAYSWIGSYGAGSGHSYSDMLKEVLSYQANKRGMKLTEGVPFEDIEDSADISAAVNGNVSDSESYLKASKAADKQAVAEGADSIDPTSPEGYAKVLESEAMQVHFQDRLDSFFGERIIDVRNALREIGWDAPNGVLLMQKEVAGYGRHSVQHDVKQVGAGRNVVGAAWRIDGGTSTIADDLTKTPAELAAAIDAAAQPSEADESEWDRKVRESNDAGAKATELREKLDAAGVDYEERVSGSLGTVFYSAEKGRFASYSDASEAQATATTLKQAGFDVHVSSDEPFTVRIVGVSQAIDPVASEEPAITKWGREIAEAFNNEGPEASTALRAKIIADNGLKIGESAALSNEVEKFIDKVKLARYKGEKAGELGEESISGRTPPANMSGDEKAAWFEGYDSKLPAAAANAGNAPEAQPIAQYPLAKTTDELFEKWRLNEVPAMFNPDASQQRMMGIVAEALDDGLFYTKDILARVEERLAGALPDDYKSRGAAGVEGGVLGMDVYYARQAVEAKRRREANISAAEKIKVGDIYKGAKVQGKTFFNFAVTSVDAKNGEVELLAAQRGTGAKFKISLPATHTVFGDRVSEGSGVAAEASAEEDPEQSAYTPFDWSQVKMPTAVQLGLSDKKLRVAMLDTYNGWTNTRLLDLAGIPNSVDAGIKKYRGSDATMISADAVDRVVSLAKNSSTLVEPVANYDAEFLDRSSTEAIKKGKKVPVNAFVLTNKETGLVVNIDKRYFGYFAKTYKGAEFYAQDAASALLVKHHGKVVGVVMPIGGADANTLKRAMKAASADPQAGYAKAKAAVDAAYARSDAADAAMKQFPKGAMGMTPDDVKATPEWKAAYAESNAALAEIQKANKYMLDNFPKEVRAERDAKRKALEAAMPAAPAAEPTPLERVNAAYSFASATDEIKEWMGKASSEESAYPEQAYQLDQPYSPLASAAAMEEAAKKHGATIEWGFFGGTPA